MSDPFVLSLAPVDVPPGYPETAVATLPCLAGGGPRAAEAEACAVECDMLGGTVTLRADPEGAHVCAFGEQDADPSEAFSCALQCVAAEPPVRVLSEPPFWDFALFAALAGLVYWFANSRLAARAVREARYIRALEAELLRLRQESLRE